jgi:hypothetical protein
MNKIDRPILAEDELEEIGHTLQNAIKDHKLVEISYFKDGFIKQKICYPDRIDPLNKQLIVRGTYGLKWQYNYKDIMDAQTSNGKNELDQFENE